MMYLRSGMCILLCTFMVLSCTQGSAQTRMNTRDYDDGKIDDVDFNSNRNYSDRFDQNDQQPVNRSGFRDQKYSDRGTDNYRPGDRHRDRNDDFRVRNNYNDRRKNRTHDDSYRRKSYFQTGTASWYGREFHGKITASGEKFNMYEYTAAHKTLPFGTIVEVKNLKNGKTIRVKINDRGPYRGKRILDLSFRAAQKLKMVGAGKAPVGITILKTGDGKYVRNNGKRKEYRSVANDFDTKGLDRDDMINDKSTNRRQSYSEKKARHNLYNSKMSYNVRNDTGFNNRYSSGSSDSRYSLQAGAFYSRRNAVKLKDKIERYVRQPVVIIKDGDFYKVRVKGFQSKSHASRFKKILRAEDIRSYTVEN